MQKMIELYGEKIAYGLKRLNDYGHSFTVEDLWFENYQGGYRFAKVDCSASSIEEAARWGADAMREWANSGVHSLNDKYFISITREWLQWGGNFGQDTGKVLGQAWDWLHFYSEYASNDASDDMYGKRNMFQDQTNELIVPEIYRIVFAQLRSENGNVSATAHIPIGGNLGLHSDFRDRDNEFSDQTHHYAVYVDLAAGSQSLARWLNDNRANDENNPGDRNLAILAARHTKRYTSSPGYYGNQFENELKNPFTP
jgi:hypothetical protein